MAAAPLYTIGKLIKFSIKKSMYFKIVYEKQMFGLW